MFEKLQILEMAHGLAVHASARQSTIARNVAHADTPGYRARDVADFSKSYQANHDLTGMKRTRAAHVLHSADNSVPAAEFTVKGRSSPNGNSVSLETEMMKATEVRHQHDLALSVYSTSMDILRTSLGRGR